MMNIVAGKAIRLPDSHSAKIAYKIKLEKTPGIINVKGRVAKKDLFLLVIVLGRSGLNLNANIGCNY